MWPRTLRNRGFSASLSYVTPTAPVSKGRRRAAAGRPARRARQRSVTAAGIRPTWRSSTPAGPTSPATDGWLQGIGGDIDPLDRFPLPNGDGYLDLAAGHGTFVAGIVRQVAPRARVTVYRAVDSDGIGTEVRVACEMIRAVKEGGADHQPVPRLPDARRPAAHRDRGPRWRSSGNGSAITAGRCSSSRRRATTATRAPAGRPRSAGWSPSPALAPDLLPAPWSSHGFWVTCSTIGQGLPSTYVAGPGVAAAGSRRPSTSAPTRGRSGAEPRSPHRRSPAPWPGCTRSTAYPLREGLRVLLDAGQPVPGYGQALKILPGA